MRKKAKRAIVGMLWPLMIFCLGGRAAAQAGGEHTLFGDVKVDESKVSGLKPMSLDIILYTEGGTVVARQTISTNGRYRFMNLPDGRYDVVVEVENNEVARLRVFVSSPFKNDFRQDIALEWKEGALPNGAKKTRAAVVDVYQRTAAHQSLFDKANAAIEKKNYEEAAALLRQILVADAKDYQSWCESGTVHLMRENLEEAERAYEQALLIKPTFALAAVNLGRLRLMRKNYAGAVEILSRTVEMQPPSADANFYLGEAYLQTRQGSKAVGYLEQALLLEPDRMAKAHLRLAALYNGAGLKQKAAAEYEQFLLKTPDYPDKDKLRRYIAENKKPSNHSDRSEQR